MSERQDSLWISDIKEAIARVEEYTSRAQHWNHGRSCKENLGRVQTQAQGCRLESDRGTRDKLIHEYFGVNWSILWDVVKNKLPQLKAQLESASESSK